jgi:hypothetical protein
MLIPPRLPNSLIPFHSKRSFLWRFNVAGKNKTPFGFQAKCPIFLPEIWNSSTDIHKSPECKIAHKAVPCDPRRYMRVVGPMDGRTGSLMPLQSKRALLWRFSVADNNKTSVGLHVKCPILLSKFGLWEQVFVEVLSIKFRGNYSSGSRTDAYGQTDRRTDMTKVMSAFSDYVNALKNKELHNSITRRPPEGTYLLTHSLTHIVKAFIDHWRNPKCVV